MERIIRFIKTWTLPLGMFSGVGAYLMFHYIPFLSPLKVLAKGAAELLYRLAEYRELLAIMEEKPCGRHHVR